MSATLGIDLASRPESTAACVMRWGGAGAELVSLGRGTFRGATLHDKYLSTAIQGLNDVGLRHEEPITKVAIDAPFGWPDAFVDAVSAHHRGERWPLDLDHSRAPFERRLTDRRVRARTGKVPLSVTTDRIAYPAMRCAVILGDLSLHLEEGAVHRDGSGLVAEAYPDAALRCWMKGVMPTGAGSSYKGKGEAAVQRRRSIVHHLVAELPLDLAPEHEELLIGWDDALDALACALVARAVERGLTTLPGDDVEQGLALREGWVHLPQEGSSLAALLE